MTSTTLQRRDERLLAATDYAMKILQESKNWSYTEEELRMWISAKYGPSRTTLDDYVWTVRNRLSVHPKSRALFSA